MTIYLSDYKTFNSTAELNEAVSNHLSYNKLNKTERDVLILLSQYSVKYSGASHLKSQTIATAVDKSIRTIRRVFNRLVELNIINVINTTRKKTGGKGANIVQILPFNSDSDDDINNNDTLNMSQCNNGEKVVTTSVSKCNCQKETIFSKSINLRTTDDTATSTNTSDQSKNDNLLKNALLDKLPSQIANIFNRFFNHKEIYDLYATMLKAKSKAHFSVQFEDDINAYTSALSNTIRLYKYNKISNLHAYLYKAVLNVSNRVGLQQAALELYS